MNNSQLLKDSRQRNQRYFSPIVFDGHELQNKKVRIIVIFNFLQKPQLQSPMSPTAKLGLKEFVVSSLIRIC